MIVVTTDKMHTQCFAWAFEKRGRGWGGGGGGEGGEDVREEGSGLRGERRGRQEREKNEM